MEIELWWLLVLPAFFVLGWVAARIDIKQLVRESRALPRSYFKGLNFLLNEQPDQAIEAFIEAARVDPETIELHFALGNLFRRRGETDRAIRVHQNLIERDGLSAKQRLHALSELGQDYLKAGLLDRAEDIFVKLRGTDRDDEALKNLLEIYQQEKEWAKAIAVCDAMPNHSDHLWQKEIAEFRCEMAANEMLHDRHDEALLRAPRQRRAEDDERIDEEQLGARLDPAQDHGGENGVAEEETGLEPAAGERRVGHEAYQGQGAGQVPQEKPKAGDPAHVPRALIKEQQEDDRHQQALEGEVDGPALRGQGGSRPWARFAGGSRACRASCAGS